MTPRQTRLAQVWAVACAVLFAALAYAVSHHRDPLGRLDDLGSRMEDWADDHGLLVGVLRVVEAGFGTTAMVVLTAALAGFLLVRGQRRAAIYAVAVMIVTSLATTGLKLWLSRERPQWQDTVDFLSSKSFPSGHASGIAAYTAILFLLVMIFVRRSGMRRTAGAALALLWLVVCLDRVLLGRHYPTDVAGGTLLALVVALAGLLVLDPTPRGHAEKAEPLPEPVPSNRQLAIVLNPVKVDDVGQFKAVVTAMALESGWASPTWHYTKIEDPGTGMAHAAAVGGADLVLVCGGDGTVREVCAELAGTGIPVGVVPAGTGNLLARNLGIPLYLRSAIDVALNGQDRAIDLAEVTGDDLEPTHFLVMAGMGLDAAIMDGVNDSIKKRVGWLAYVVSALKSLMVPAVRIDIAIDGGDFTRHRARTVVVGNVGYLQAGMPLMPDAAIDDGLLDVVILYPRRFLSWVPLAVRVLSKQTRTDATVNRMTGHTISLRAVTDTPRQLDGDSIGQGRELTMTCVHGRLLVRVPR